MITTLEITDDHMGFMVLRDIRTGTGNELFDMNYVTTLLDIMA